MMKKLAFILLSLIIVSCATESDRKAVIRELAKKDAIEKLDLPEGTKFNNENIEVTETDVEDGTIGVNYLVKITIKSQDRDGNEIVKVHTFKYNKADGDGSSPNHYELISHE
ncbi:MULTISPECIES: hypothetical protein [Aequorivita]|uniref:hypothetical protein n=1 Tax=Aequorivita TaxID=153265 RepID=UPI002301968A|nr:MULTISPECIES: hypothetical protein [Aequorivita]